MNLKGIKSKRIKDSANPFIKALEVIENITELVDPFEGANFVVTEEELGTPITEKLRRKVEEYLTDQFAPEEDSEDYEAWELDGIGPQVSVDIVEDGLEIDIYYNFG